MSWELKAGQKHTRTNKLNRSFYLKLGKDKFYLVQWGLRLERASVAFDIYKLVTDILNLHSFMWLMKLLLKIDRLIKWSLQCCSTNSLTWLFIIGVTAYMSCQSRYITLLSPVKLQAISFPCDTLLTWEFSDACHTSKSAKIQLRDKCVTKDYKKYNQLFIKNFVQTYTIIS